jgi:hypothetical protein
MATASSESAPGEFGSDGTMHPAAARNVLAVRSSKNRKVPDMTAHGAIWTLVNPPHFTTLT